MKKLYRGKKNCPQGSQVLSNKNEELSLLLKPRIYFLTTSKVYETTAQKWQFNEINGVKLGRKSQSAFCCISNEKQFRWKSEAIMKSFVLEELLKNFCFERAQIAADSFLTPLIFPPWA